MKQTRKDKSPQGELLDAFTGVAFTPRARNHYETNSGVPFAPPVKVNRPTIRQRIDNLLDRGVDPLARYVGTEGIDMDVPDDPDAPMTPSEQNYLDTIAAELAEAAPLPDEGMPRPQGSSPGGPSGVQGAEPPAEGAPAPVPAPVPNGGKSA